MNILQKIHAPSVRWITAPEVNAAGRIGLARIVYSLFYLWMLSDMVMSELASYRPGIWTPRFLSWFESPSEPTMLLLLEAVLVFGLALLLLGFSTRLATLIVLVVGMTLFTIRNNNMLGTDRILMLMVFYVPLFMLASQWGSTYSIDALLRQRRGQSTPAPTDSSWHYFWPVRGLLAVLSTLFLTAAVVKLQNQVWLTNPRFVGDLMLEKSVTSLLNNGFPANPLTPLIARADWLVIPLQYITLLFEFFFFLVLFSRVARAVVFRYVPIFHSANTFFLGIPFTPILSIYIPMVDWQMLYTRFYPERLRLRGLNRLPTVALIGGSIGLALGTALLWNTTPLPRAVFGLFGIVNFHTIWFVIAPLGVVWIVVSLHHLWTQRRQDQQTALPRQKSETTG